MQAKYCTKYCNGILSHTWGHVTEEVRARGWGCGWGGVVGDKGHYFLFTKFFEIFYMFKTFYMAALDSFVTFSPNLSKFFGRGGGSVRWFCEILTNLSKFISYWEGKGSTSTWTFWKTFMNFLPLVYEELQNMSAESDKKLSKSELI